MASQPSAGRVLVYDRIGANKRETWLLMVGFVLLIGGLVAAIAYSMQLPVGVTGAAGIALITYALVSYWLSTSIVLSISGAHEVTKEEEW